MKPFIGLITLVISSSAIAQSVNDLPSLTPKSSDSDKKPIEQTEEKGIDEKALKEALKARTEAREIAGPEKITTHTIKPGGSLTAVSEEAYGRTRYWRILKLYNEVDPSRLQVGQQLKAPDIPWLLSSCGLEHHFPKAVTNILKVKELLTTIQDKPTPPTDADLSNIRKTAELISEAQTELLTKQAGITGRPTATVKQLQTVKSHLLHIANKTRLGRTDPHSLAHEHLSNAIVYGVLWAQGDFQ